MNILNQSSSRRICAVYARLLMLLLCVLSGGAHAQATISAIPNVFSSGATIKVSMEGLALSTNYRLRLEQGRTGTNEFDLLEFSSGSGTTSIKSVRIPTTAAGSYELVLYRVSLGTTRLADAPVTVAVSPVVSFTPTEAAPGRKVRIDVSNLVAGSVRVRYAGATILGPLAVGAGSFSGYFLVPGDRPASLPATVPVVVDNLVGRVVVRSASATFSALAPSGAPRLGFQVMQAPSTQVKPSAPFNVSGMLRTEAGAAPTGRQQLYWRGNNGQTFPMDTDVAVGSDGALVMQARAPSQWLDGFNTHQDRPGRMIVVNQGLDRDTSANRDGRFVATEALDFVIDGRDATTATFSLIVRGFQSGGGGPLLNGAIVEAAADFQSAFFAQSRRTSSQPISDYQVWMAAAPNQLRTLSILNQPPNTPANYGCQVTLFRKITTTQGRATFTISPDEITRINGAGIAHGGGCPPLCEEVSVGAKGGNIGLTYFSMNIYAAHLGYRNASISIGYDSDTGKFYNQNEGRVFPDSGEVVVLERSEDSDFDLRTLLIDGIGGPERKLPGECTVGQGGECYHTPYRYQSMYTFPDSARWPNADFDAFNTGRKARLTIDTTVYGALTSGRIRIGNTAWANFIATSGTPACLTEAPSDVSQGKVEYIADLPDLTRLPAGTVESSVELSFGSSPTRTFPIRLYTNVPGVDRSNPNVASMRINALTDRITGDYNTPGQDIAVDPPGHGVGRMDSMTENAGDFILARSSDGIAIEDLKSTTNNDVAANPGGTDSAAGVFFGFTNSNHNVAVPLTLFDTGLIPLFRYTWGLPPIAGATLGADMWMAATLRYYGQLRAQGMNATIDPVLAGGVDIFFDLSLLLGLVSGSMSAESEVAIAMRANFNQGGFAHLPNNPSPAPGRCFNFDLDGVWEACAAGFCEGGRESLLTVREPGNCSINKADQIPLMLRRFAGLDAKADPQSVTNFDLLRPRYTATALGSDGRGNAITLGVDTNGSVVATHVTGGLADQTRVRTVAVNTVAVQQLDVAFFATNRALAVWSENTRTLAEVETLMRTQRGRAFDDLARTQRLRFSSWDGRAWSAPADLTSIGSDGKPQLAGCLASPRYLVSRCPAGGEITAVWEHDANANLDAPDLEIWSASWDPGRGWTSPARVNATGVSSDMLPSVAYRNEVPVVAWAHNPGGAFTDLARRQVAYRFLDGSSAQVIASALGSGVGWVDVGVSSADAVVVAYTIAQDRAGFVGNRQALHAARATSCTRGECAFLVTEVRDPAQRQIRIERPRVAFDENDAPVIGFRALAYGPNRFGQHAVPGDLTGITLGTGELGMVRVHSFARPTYTAQLVGLSDNGLQHWKPDFIYDETLGGVLAVSMEATAPIGERTAQKIAQQMSPEGSPFAVKASVLSDGSSLRMASGGPDFSVSAAALSASIAASGQPLQLTLTLNNVGAAYNLAEHGSVQVIASLNGPAGVGAPLGSFTLASNQASNASTAVNIDLTLPAGVQSDERQTVFIDIQANDEANAMDGTADHDRIEINAMPIPTQVNAATRKDSPFISLTWADPGDARVAGWRIWKLVDGTWMHLGSTPVPGYLVVVGTVGGMSSYRVASYSANGMESEPSDAITAQIEQSLGNTIFADDFETVAP